MTLQEDTDAAPKADLNVDVEEAKDAMPSSGTMTRRQKVVSDIAKMLEDAPRAKRADRRTVSDMVLFMTLPDDEQTRHPRRRQKSSTDSIMKSAYVPALKYDDLKLAEKVAVVGLASERHEQGITDEEFERTLTEDEPQDEFEFNPKGLTSEKAEELLKLHGRNELPDDSDPKWLIFLRLFIAPMPIMIWIAVIIELGIQNYIDMGILLVIQFTNAFISFYETTKAGDAIAALKSSLKPTATVKRNGKWEIIEGALVVPGDCVLLASGSAVPADCRVNHGEIDVDQAALTGESLPVNMFKGDSCKMGSTVVRGETEATVEFTGSETFFGKTASLLQQKHELSHLQKILMAVSYFKS